MQKKQAIFLCIGISIELAKIHAEYLQPWFQSLTIKYMPIAAVPKAYD